MIQRIKTFFLMVFLTGLILQQAIAGDHDKLSPYDAVRWKNESPEVHLDGDWFALKSINGLLTQHIVLFAKKEYAERWRKRFEEDLVQVLVKMGHPPENTVDLVVLDLKTGKEINLDQVLMSEKNRRLIIAARHKKEASQDTASAVTSEDMEVALNVFKSALDERWSYRHANDVDFEKAIYSLRQQIKAGISVNNFAIELQKIISLGVDGHATVKGFKLLTKGYLPFLIEPQGERFVAFEADRTRFLSDGMPYITKIDGKTVTEWCQGSSVFVPKGSNQYVQQHCLRYLRYLNYFREVFNLPKKDMVEVELVSEDGNNRKTLMLPIAKKFPTYGLWPHSRSHLMEGNIGYLRLPSMNKGALQEVKQWMPEFRETSGLIVDVRDNGGGSRETLQLLYSYLTHAADSPRVINAAAYRLHESHQNDHLASRFMYTVDSQEWSNQERQAIARFSDNFIPQWKLPHEQFSDWHYMVLSGRPGTDVFYYDKPVIVLMNSKCFSATDIFLAGLKGMPNVTLLGTPSGGGSARSQQIDLGKTSLRLQIGSMVSYQANGQLFDGHGVRPDWLVEANAEYHIGGEDNVLEEAIMRLNKKREQHNTSQNE